MKKEIRIKLKEWVRKQLKEVCNFKESWESLYKETKWHLAKEILDLIKEVEEENEKKNNNP